MAIQQPRFVDGRSLAVDLQTPANAIAGGLTRMFDNQRQEQQAMAKQQQMQDMQDTYTDLSAIKSLAPEKREAFINQRMVEYESAGDFESAANIGKLLDYLGQGNLDSFIDPQIGVLASQLGIKDGGSARSGFASAKTEIYPNGVTVQSLPDGSTQVRDESGLIVEGNKRLDALKRGQKSRAVQAGDIVTSEEDARTKQLAIRENTLVSKTQKIEKQQIELLKEQAEFDAIKAKQEIQQQGVLELATLGQELLDSDLDSIYGRGESLYPDLFRGQKGIDTIAKKNRFVASLELAAAGKMKGQGQLSDGERKILKEGATILSNQDISPEAARAEVNRILPTYQKAVNSQGLQADNQININDIDNMTEAELDAYLAK